MSFFIQIYLVLTFDFISQKKGKVFSLRNLFAFLQKWKSNRLAVNEEAGENLCFLLFDPFSSKLNVYRDQNPWMRKKVFEILKCGRKMFEIELFFFECLCWCVVDVFSIFHYIHYRTKRRKKTGYSHMKTNALDPEYSEQFICIWLNLAFTLNHRRNTL